MKQQPLVSTFIHQQQSKIKNLSTRVFHESSLLLSQSTPYQSIAQFQKTSVRYYRAEKKRYQQPLVFTAPLAINMAIYDLYPYRSLIQYYTQQGFDVYLLDWGQLNYRDRDLDFMFFVQQAMPVLIDAICQHSKSKEISLHGWSMAGIFVLLYTALHPDAPVKNLIVLGSPIDSYASGHVGSLYAYLNGFLKKHKSLQARIYHGLPKRLIHSSGRLNALGFKILDPVGWLKGNIQLFQNLNNLDFIKEHATLGNFLNNMVDYPAGINQDMMLNVWLQNPLKKGTIRLKNTIIELKNIHSSLLVGAGKNDQMVTSEATFPLTQLTSSPDVTFTLIPGGHLGLMSSQASAEEFWPFMKDWLAQRSTPITDE